MDSSPLSAEQAGPPPSDEPALIRSCQSGRLQDFDPLYQRYVRRIFSFIYRRTLDRQTAEDITSVVFLRAIEKIGGFDPAKGALGAWFYGIARNALTDHYRAHRPHTDIENVWDLASTEDVSVAADARMSYDKLKDTLKSLKPAHRDIVLMRVWEGLSYKEIAGVTGQSEDACKMTFSRVVAKLRKDFPLTVFILLLLNPFTL